jgi:hypothetical protein
MSQTQIIYRALKRGRRLTMDSIRALCGSLNGHKRIREIERQYGITVAKRSITRNGRKLTQWSLA